MSFNMRRTSLSLVFLTLSLLLSAISTQIPIAAAASNCPASLQEAAFSLDGVNVSLCSPFLPAKTFTTSQPDDVSQVATSFSLKPYREFSITAVPYGAKNGTGNLGVAKAGSEESFRQNLQKFRRQQGAEPQVGPSITIFGKTVSGYISQVKLPLDGVSLKDSLVIEWVIEAGQRIWIVRVAEELPASPPTTRASSKLPASFTDLNQIAINSTNLNNPSTSAKRTAPIPEQNQSRTPQPRDLPTPSWWNGDDCDHTHYYNGSGGWSSYRLGATYLGTPTCGPRPSIHYEHAPDVLAYFGGGGAYEWECVEFSMRVLYLAYGVNPYPANGNQVVTEYKGTKLKPITNGTNGVAPQPGDVLSYGPTDPDGGHTSVVTASSVDNNGNGTIAVAEENSSSTGSRNLNVSNWTVQAALPVSAWLHDPTQDSRVYNVSPVLTSQADGTPEIFVTGPDSGMWYLRQDIYGTWQGWKSLGGTFPTQSPSVVLEQNGKLEVFARGWDSALYHNYQTDTTGDGWSGWFKLGSNEVMTGRPAAFVNSYGNPEVIMRRSDGSMWHIVYSPGTGWSPWYPLGGSWPAGADPIVSRNGPGEPEIFMRGNDNQLYHNYFVPGSDWAGWFTLGGNLSTNPGVVRRSQVNGYLENFARFQDGAMYHQWYDPTNGWSAWFALGGSWPLDSDPAVVINLQGNPEIFNRGNDNQIYHAWYDPTNGWSSWFSLGGSFAGSFSTYVNRDGEQEVFGMGNDHNSVWHAWFPKFSQPAWSSLASLSFPGLAFPTISASPNPVPGGSNTSTISWNMGNQNIGQIYVSVNGGSEALFIQGSSGNSDANWIALDTVYIFRLYAGTSHDVMLNKVRVTANRASLMVSNSVDNGNTGTSGTLSYALKNATSGQTITFASGITSVTVKGSLPPLAQGAKIQAACSSPVTISGSDPAASADGLTLLGNNYLTGIKLSGFRGRQIVLQGTGNHFSCSSFSKV